MGYCSYFAFSMALMCRSIGIPARVAAGFFIDPESGVLNVYPVREDMAHAWVEVPFDGFGWVEFDPTSERIARERSSSLRPSTAANTQGLIEEIISNEYEASEDRPELMGAEEPVSPGDLLRAAGRAVRRFWYILLPLFWLLYLFTRDVLWRLALRIRCGRNRIKYRYYNALHIAAPFRLQAAPRREPSRTCAPGRSRGGGDRKPRPLLPRIGVFEGGRGRARRAGRRGLEHFSSELQGDSAAPKALCFSVPAEGPRGGRTLRRDPVAGPCSASSFGIRAGRRLGRGCGGPGSSGPSWYITAAAREIDSEDFSEALRLLNEGISLFPESWELRKAAGDLYSDRELYNLALGQYEEAAALAPGNVDILYGKSVGRGLLNLDDASILTLERILELDSETMMPWRIWAGCISRRSGLDQAETLLLSAVEEMGSSPISA